MSNAPLDLILVRKIGVPTQPELAMGAVVDGLHPLTVRNEEVIKAAGVTQKQFNAIRDHELGEIRRRRIAYLGGRRQSDIAGRVAIIVDDGVATGATAQAALRATKQRNPKKLVLAIPVAPTDTLAELRQEADEIVCLEEYQEFGAIGSCYSNFDQLNDSDVRVILARVRGA